jgi:hypothetical protein
LDPLAAWAGPEGALVARMRRDHMSWYPPPAAPRVHSSPALPPAPWMLRPRRRRWPWSLAACALTLAGIFAIDQAGLTEPILLRVCAGVSAASTTVSVVMGHIARRGATGLDRASDLLADELGRRFPRGDGPGPLPAAIANGAADSAPPTQEAPRARATSSAPKRHAKHASRKRHGKRSLSRAPASRHARAS